MRLEQASIERIADALAATTAARPTWREPPHWWDDTSPTRTAAYVLLLDLLNYSFWSEPTWHVVWHGMRLDGYRALAACLRRAFEEGLPLAEPAYLQREASAATLLAGADGTRIPLLRARQAALREAGLGLARTGGLLALVEHSGGTGATLVRQLEQHFPSFRDVADYSGRPIPFYKRAQILVADLWGAFEGRGPGAFHDLGTLTMFADYKVPRVLHGLGALRYSDTLERSLRARELIPYGDPREVEIRAGSVQAVERICQALRLRGRDMPPFEVDWRLWEHGQGRARPLPYHRTRSVAY